MIVTMSKNTPIDMPVKEASTCATGATCSCSHEHTHSTTLSHKQVLSIAVSTLLLVLGMMGTYTSLGEFIPSYLLVVIYALAYIPVAYPVLKEAYEAVVHSHDFFNEFSLMSIATLGAFAIGEYPEAVAVMLLYSIGEFFQARAVGKATQNIESLLDVRVEEARVVTDAGVKVIPSEQVSIGSRLQVRVGDKLPVDGVLLSEKSSFNTVALTGESVPRTLYKGESVLAGMINLSGVIEVETTKEYKDSALSKILDLVEHATDKKAKTELMVRKWARWYTPAVFGLAMLVVLLPALFVVDYVFSDWLYRALVFLVISCPCAIVISIPLSYFGGIGAASRHGILFKGANYLDIMQRVNTVVLDKTGTLTAGVFDVQKVEMKTNKEELLDLLSALETHSSHPIAQAILKYHPAQEHIVAQLSQVSELAGRGMRCLYKEKVVLVGNAKLLNEHQVSFDSPYAQEMGTTILMAYDGTYQGAILIADQIKADSKEAIQELHNLGIDEVVLLSGDNTLTTQYVGREVGVNQAIGDLLPDEKLAHIEQLQKEQAKVICFVGDGINDAPSLALSDVGVAMGAMGADMAIEVADVVIQTDQLSKLPQAKKIAKATRNIVFQNIALAIGVKVFVLLLGAMGIATMWEAVLADVGVTLLAVLNAIRILYQKY